MNNLKTVPNQKVITVKKQPTDKQNYYTMINLNALESAGRDLKSGAFKLWVYLAQNQNNYTFALSNKAVAEYFGIKKDQYDNAVKELIEKGYLIETAKNKYKFVELAVKDTIKSGEKPQKEMVKDTTENVVFPLEKQYNNNTNNNTKENTFVF